MSFKGGGTPTGSSPKICWEDKVYGLSSKRPKSVSRPTPPEKNDSVLLTYEFVNGLLTQESMNFLVTGYWSLHILSLVGTGAALPLSGPNDWCSISIHKHGQPYGLIYSVNTVKAQLEAV